MEFTAKARWGFVLVFHFNYTCLVDMNGALISIYSRSNEMFLSHLSHLPPGTKTSKYHHTRLLQSDPSILYEPIQSSLKKLMNKLYDMQKSEP